MKKSLISAIKKLLTKLGAQEVDGNNLVDVISNGADMITVNKAYIDALAPFVITVTNNDGTFTGDKTDLQIKDAINNNRQIIVVLDIDKSAADDIGTAQQLLLVPVRQNAQLQTISERR